jgi:hypothetical protein
MSCPDYLISELGRRGVGVVQPQSGIDYPFVAPSDDIKYLIADLHVSVDDFARLGRGGKEFVPPFRVAYLYGLGCVENSPPSGFLAPTHTADIVICDANGTAVFDSSISNSAADFSATAWGTNYTLYSWRNYVGACSVLAYTTWPATDSDKRNYNKHLQPENGILDARAVYVAPKRLLSLRVDDGPTVTGNVVIRNGYSTELAAGAESVTNFVTDTAVTLSANPGSGLGKYSTCGEDTLPVTQPIKRINGVTAPDGSFLLAATDCMYVRRPTTIIDGLLLPSDYLSDTDTLQRPLEIGAVCDACCKCNDYVDLALKVNKYRSQYAFIGTRVNETKLIHEQNIQKWNDARACGLESLFKIQLVPQRCPFMDVVISVCNACATCLNLGSLELYIQAENKWAFPTIVPGSVILSVDGVTSHPAINVMYLNQNLQRSKAKTLMNIPFPPVKTSGTGYIRFRLKFPEDSPTPPPPNREYAISASVIGYLANGQIVPSGCDEESANWLYKSQTLTLVVEPNAVPDAHFLENGPANEILWDVFQELEGSTFGNYMAAMSDPGPPPEFYPWIFSINPTGDDATAFAVGTHNGLVTLTAPADYEQKQFYDVKVDCCRISLTQRDVFDALDALTSHPYMWFIESGERVPYRFSVRQTMGDSASFSVNEYTGVVRFVESQPTKPTYSVWLDVTPIEIDPDTDEEKAGTPFAWIRQLNVCASTQTKTKLYRVKDVNEFPLRFVSDNGSPLGAGMAGGATIMANGPTAIYFPAVVDADGSKECGTVTFSFVDNPDNLLIDATTGAVSLPSPLEDGADGGFNFTLRATNWPECGDQTDSAELEVGVGLADRHDFNSLRPLSPGVIVRAESELIASPFFSLINIGYGNGIRPAIVKCSLADGSYDSSLFLIDPSGSVRFKDMPNFMRDKTKYTFVVNFQGVMPAVARATQALYCDENGDTNWPQSDS